MLSQIGAAIGAAFATIVALIFGRKELEKTEVRDAEPEKPLRCPDDSDDLLDDFRTDKRM